MDKISLYCLFPSPWKPYATYFRVTVFIFKNKNVPSTDLINNIPDQMKFIFLSLAHCIWTISENDSYTKEEEK